MIRRLLGITSALLLIGVAAAEAQYTSDSRIRVQKDIYLSGGDVALEPNADMYISEARLARDWYRPSGTVCSNRVDRNEVRMVDIDADLYNPATMISPDSAKFIALCAVPGRIGSGEMEVNDGRTEYEIAIIPEGKRTYSKVIIDAQTGAVLSTKQFGGARGFTGWLRENFERQQNTP